MDLPPPMTGEGRFKTRSESIVARHAAQFHAPARIPGSSQTHILGRGTALGEQPDQPSRRHALPNAQKNGPVFGAVEGFKLGLDQGIVIGSPTLL